MGSVCLDIIDCQVVGCILLVRDPLIGFSVFYLSYSLELTVSVCWLRRGAEDIESQEKAGNVA